jgi:membrane associated rhomboid family serine protease
MGIGDRTYMRSLNPGREPWSATAWTLGVLVFVFILGLIEQSAGVHFLGWAPLDESNLRPWQPLTHLLIHDGFWHLLGNGLVLWWTGRLVENDYGKKTYFLVLIGGALTGAILWWVTGLGGPQQSGLMGISAGVYALMMVALLDKPDHSITLLLFFFIPVTLRVRWLIILTAVFTLVSYMFSELPDRHHWNAWHAAWDSSIAHSAHLGGLIFGWLAFRRLQQTNLYVSGTSYSVSPNSPSKFSPGHSTTDSDVASNTSRNQAKIDLDVLLDKISASGFGSLTPEEKRKLEELSARLR